MKPKLYTSATVPGGQGGAISLGTDVGDALATDVGAALTATVGDALATDVGAALPATVGDALGNDVGAALGFDVDSDDLDGPADGANVGFEAGSQPDLSALRT